MTERELLLRQMSSKPGDLLPNWEFAFWSTTVPAWHQQGLPREIDTTSKAFAHMGITSPHPNLDYWALSLNLRLLPAFEPVCLGREGEQELWKDQDGVTYAQVADG
ncbi:MAG: hypothetical protein IT440_14860, partial [Phycisphaeraceae bacterium]|nr:hypothetical protein [Phycisphaeraceae bacterium]